MVAILIQSALVCQNWGDNRVIFWCCESIVVTFRNLPTVFNIYFV